MTGLEMLQSVQYVTVKDKRCFHELAERTAPVGEIGLDTGSHVPLEVQLRTFRQALEVVADLLSYPSDRRL